MSCVLRVSGRDLVAEDLLRACPIPACRVFRKGEPLTITSLGGIQSASGANFVVSERDMNDLAGQTADAIAFLKVNGHALRSLSSLPGVEHAVLDFGIGWRDVAVQSDRFPAELLRLAGGLGLELEVSRYPVGEPENEQVAGA
jgi:hypothetical protein